VQILPFVIWVVFDPERFSFTVRVRIDKCCWEKITLIYAPVIAQTQRPVDSRIGDGPPEVDYLEATFKELWDIGGREMSVNTRDRGLVGLVNVHLGHWLTPIGAIVKLAWTTATNGWGNEYIVSYTMIYEKEMIGHLLWSNKTTRLALVSDLIRSMLSG